MLEYFGVERALPDAGTIDEGVRVYHRFKDYEKKAEEFGVVAFVVEPFHVTELNQEQQRFVNTVMKSVDNTVKYFNAGSEADAEDSRQEAMREGRVCICLEPPGTVHRGDFAQRR